MSNITPAALTLATRLYNSLRAEGKETTMERCVETVQKEARAVLFSR